MLVNVALFGISLLMTLLSTMSFDAPDAWQHSGLGLRTWWILVFTMPLPLGAAIFSAIRFHEKGLFGAVMAVTLSAIIYLVFPYILLFFSQR